MDKRGEFSTVARILLLVVFALLILFAVGRFILFIVFQSAETSCAQSIVKSGVDGVPNFDCKAERLTISQASLEANANRELDEQGLDDAVKRAVANELYACWKNTGRGMVDPYSKSFEMSAISVGMPAISDVYLICDIVKFKDIPPFKGLLFWMTINKPQGGDEPYFDIVFNRKPTLDEIAELEKMDDRYDTSKEYAVAWRYVEDYNHMIFMPYQKLGLPKVNTEMDAINRMDETDKLWLYSNKDLAGKSFSPIVMN